VDNSEYEKSMERVRNALAELVNENWTGFRELRDGMYGRHVEVPSEGKGVNEKASSMLLDNRYIPNSQVRGKMSTLLAISEERFYHGTDFWDEFAPAIPADERLFYASMLIHQAKTRPAKEFGHSWIVRQYDNGKLKEYISQDTLAESVNKGFWELANEYFTYCDYTILGPNVPWGIYTTLMEYSKHMDLTRFKELWDRPLHDRTGWPDRAYLKAYEHAKLSGLLKAKELGFLASPIIEKIFNTAFDPMRTDVEPTSYLKRNLKNYPEAVNTPTVQLMLKEMFSHRIKALGSDESNLFYAMLIEGYLRMDEGAKRRLASSSLNMRDGELANDLVSSKFPVSWLTDEAKSSVQSRIAKAIDETYSKISFKSLIEHISYINESMKLKLLDERIGDEKLARAVTFYIESKRRPGGDVAQEMYSLPRLEGISPDLDIRMRDSALGDMLLRRVSTDVAECRNENWVQRGRPWPDRGTDGVQLSFKGFEIRQSIERSRSKAR
jgi:hypothetical protein